MPKLENSNDANAGEGPSTRQISKKKPKQAQDVDESVNYSLKDLKLNAQLKKRREANNARERNRINNINDALKELERLCKMHVPIDKSSSKINVVNMAVDVIRKLEKKVREKNPSALCLRKEIRGKVKGDKPESILKDYLTKPLQRTVQAPIYHPVLLTNNKNNLPKDDSQR